MNSGYNSNLSIRGKDYHVQTEDWGQNNPYIVTRVFHNGAVVKSVKRSYAEVFQNGPVSDQKSIEIALRVQHQEVINEFMEGEPDKPRAFARPSSL